MRHFAGDVTYQVEAFVQKNTETMEAQTRQLLRAPGLAFLKPILEQQRVVGAFAADADVPPGLPPSTAAGGGVGQSALLARSGAGANGTLAAGGGRWGDVRKAAMQTSLNSSSSSSDVGRVATSTGKRFLRDMSRLMGQLQASSAHFVHCVKPNGMEQPELLSYEMVAEQLTSLGTLETTFIPPLACPPLLTSLGDTWQVLLRRSS